jgi:hypothetical protein
MTATVEHSTKLGLLRAKEAELAIAVDEAIARVAAYPEQLHEARSRAIYARPNVRPGAELNGEVAKITAKERKDVASLNGLQGDLSAVRSLIVTEAARVHEEETAEARKQLKLLHEQEASVWANAGGLLGELATAWNSYVEHIEQSHQVASANGLESSDARAVIPGPATFEEFISLLLAASTDEDVRSEPYTEQLVDSGIYGRRGSDGEDLGGAVYDTKVVGTRTVDTRRRLDERDVLYRVVPDLRHVVRAPKI